MSYHTKYKTCSEVRSLKIIYQLAYQKVIYRVQKTANPLKSLQIGFCNLKTL